VETDLFGKRYSSRVFTYFVQSMIDNIPSL